MFLNNFIFIRLLPGAGAVDTAAVVAAGVCLAQAAWDTVEGKAGTEDPVEVRLVLPGTVSVVAEIIVQN